MTNERESDNQGEEPHDVREARKIVAKPHDPSADISVVRMLALGLIRYYEAGRSARPRGMGGDPGVQKMT